MPPLVEIQRHGDLAMIVIDHPPINALSTPLRCAIRAAIDAVMADPTLRCAVIACLGRSFIAGADLREFDQPPGDVTTSDICTRLDAAAKPVVAALHGTALGEGFEIALACHARIMSPDASVGLPQSRFGLIPGAGGTQRLPRLAGPIAALDLVATGRHVPADAALRLGLVDEIATDLRKQASHRARALAEAGHWPVASRRDVPPVDRAAFDAALATIRRRAQGAIAPVAAGEAIAWALDLPVDAALARERATWLELRAGPQCRALRHLFHAERVAARAPEIAGRTPTAWPLRHVGIIGGGPIGASLAVALLEAGLHVTLVETALATAAAAEARIRAAHARLIGAGRETAEAIDARLRRLAYTYRLERLKDADLVIEAITEDLAAKQDVFHQLSFAVRRDCILASTTARLDIDRLADRVDAPERVLGLHLPGPAQATRLIEIIRAERTLPEVLATALSLARRLGKQPVIAGGFIADRIHASGPQLAAMINEGAKCLAEGVAQRPSDIDVALVHGHGFPAWRGGPMHAADALGLATVLDQLREPPARLLLDLATSGRTFATLNG